MLKWTIAFLILAACGAATESKGGGQALAPAAQAEAPSFDRVNREIFQPRCLSCHAQYASYEGVKREIGAIARAVESDRMPKSGSPLSRDQKSLLGSWIAAGAPGGSEPAPPEQPLAPNYRSIQEKILAPKCVACHNPQGQAKFLDLSTKDAFLQAKDRVFGDGKKLLDFDDPERSYLLEVVRDPEEPMPPTWSNLERLTPDEISVLGQWIGLRLP